MRQVKILPLSLAINENNFLMPQVTMEELRQGLVPAENFQADLVLTPQYVIGKDDPAREEKESLLSAWAAQQNCYVVYNTYEDGKCVSYILDRTGAKVGSYVKTHAVSGLDVALELGDELPVFDLDFGKVALLAGTDLYIPELAEVYSHKGAQILLCSMGIEPLRDDTQWQHLYKARAVGDYFFVAASDYASRYTMYMTNNMSACHVSGPKGMALIGKAEDFNTNGMGRLTGRACVYDLRGECIASSSREGGCAFAVLDMDKKINVKNYLYGLGELVFHQNERGVFNELAENYGYRKKVYPVKNPIITFAHMTYEDTIGVTTKGPMEEQEINYQKLFAYMNQAAEYSDMVIFSELSAPGNSYTPELGKKYGEIARKNRCYILINQEIEKRNYSILFDRSGEEIFRYEKVNGLCFMYEKKLPVGDKLPVIELDFATIGVMVCADIYCQEIPRILALKGADLIVLQSQSWGFDSAAINEGVARGWAIESGVEMVISTFASSQVAHRSNIIDPTGETVFATAYDREGLYPVRVDVDAVLEHKSYIWQDGEIQEDHNFRGRLFAARRPELYLELTTVKQ